MAQLLRTVRANDIPNNGTFGRGRLKNYRAIYPSPTGDVNIPVLAGPSDRRSIYSNFDGAFAVQIERMWGDPPRLHRWVRRYHLLQRDRTFSHGSPLEIDLLDEPNLQRPVGRTVAECQRATCMCLRPELVALDYRRRQADITTDGPDTKDADAISLLGTRRRVVAAGAADREGPERLFVFLPQAPQKFECHRFQPLVAFIDRRDIGIDRGIPLNLIKDVDDHLVPSSVGIVQPGSTLGDLLMDSLCEQNEF